MSNLMPDVNTIQLLWGGEFDYEEVPRNLLGAKIARDDLRAVGFTSMRWEPVPTMEQLDSISGWHVRFQAIDHTNNEGRFYIECDSGAALYIISRNKRLSFSVAAVTDEIVNAELCVVQKSFPVEPMRLDDTSVKLGVWTAAPNGGAFQRDKMIAPLIWDDIYQNYTPDTRTQLDKLLQVRPPLDGGRLILCHGDPGTGKSSFIRALMRAWLPWCNTHYVTDPEDFFGSANYMLSVLLSNSNAQPDWDFEFDEEKAKIEDLYTLKGVHRWNLLIIEDADEFLRTDAKERTGQALSRLLNLSDGLLGQGMNFMVLITTNEPLANIHKAVQREGRCFANVHFNPFSMAQAAQWLELHGHRGALNAGPLRDEYSLAQLYDLRHEVSQIHHEEKTYSSGVYL